MLNVGLDNAAGCASFPFLMAVKTLCCLGVVVTLMASAQAQPNNAPAKVAGFSFVKTLGPISEYRLDANGLQVLLLPEHSSPTLTFMVTYRVGSRNEVTGTTGATHLLEHLMFKGSEKFNDAKGNSVKQLLERIGGARITSGETPRDTSAPRDSSRGGERSSPPPQRSSPPPQEHSSPPPPQTRPLRTSADC